MYPTVVQAHDDELKKRILISLQSRGVDRLDHANIQVSGGVVLMSGDFSSTSARHLALECCRHVAGVLRIEDSSKAECNVTTSEAADRVVVDAPAGAHTLSVACDA
jgi:osmotically-inducible protein OsmY